MRDETNFQRALIVLMRLSIGWVFLYAGINQVPDPNWSAAGFLSGAKTFPAFYNMVATPPLLPIANAVIPWLHLLIGLAVISGLFFRLAASGATALFILYYLPRLDFPMVGPHEYIVEYHLVYAMLTIYLIAIGAGRVFGLDGWLEKRPAVQAYKQQHPVIGLALG